MSNNIVAGNDSGTRCVPPGDRPSHPAPDGAPQMWGSDAMAEQLRRMGIEFLSLTPGSSFRGLHDSIVNYLGNEGPRIVLSLNEESAVAIAHGYAKVTDSPMAVALHANVGLMHAVMAIFNAWCDRAPMLVVGATGPLAADQRRPWIDWIHTAGDQGALVRNFIKWDDQPASVQAAVESLARAALVAGTHPHAPVYVNIDSELQEGALNGARIAFPPPERTRPPAPPAPRPDDVARVWALLRDAQRPLLVLGRVSRSQSAWDDRVRLAEAIGALVLPDLKVASAFPSDHPLNAASPATFLTEAGRRVLRAADVVVALDVVDLAGTLRQAYGDDPVDATIVSCSQDFVLHNGWAKDHFGLAPVDVPIPTHPDAFVAALLVASLAGGQTSAPGWSSFDLVEAPAMSSQRDDDAPLSVGDVGAALKLALRGVETCLARIPLGWDGADIDIIGPLDYLGSDGGGGLGSGPGTTVGAALALWDSARLVVSVLGDGDFLMGAQALWTAAHYRLPLLVVVVNNRSFLNDEIHQERVAVHRGRPVANRWIGQRLDDPAPDIAGLARSLGLDAHGPVTTAAELEETLALAVAAAVNGAAVVVDVHIDQKTYSVGFVGR